MSDLTLLSEVKCFGGYLKRYQHKSSATNTDMKFSIYLPPQAQQNKVPVLYYLSGLTCTDENFVMKAGAQRDAARLGLALVAPDTSPRGANIEGETDSWDFGVGAGFYVDATEPKWSKNYNMYTYVTQELPALITQNFPVVADRQSITGHSMGGLGALLCALKNPGKYKVSACRLLLCSDICSLCLHLPQFPTRWSVRGARRPSRGTWELTRRSGR